MSMNYYSRSNLAYDFTLFEEDESRRAYARRKSAGDKAAETESDSKPNNEATEEISARDRRSSRDKSKQKSGKKSKVGGITLLVIFGIAFAFIVVSIIHGQVQLTELNQEIVNAKAELAEKQSEHTQLQMKVDSSISTAVVEEYARDNLKMSKATNSQKEFVNLSEGDKAEVSMDKDKNIFEAIADAFASLWS